jgi:predicted nucleotidyltransferase component of viral defense system
MSDAINQILERYKCVTQQDYKNALKEIIQKIILLGLWRSKFFEKAAFCGASSLKILFGLNRFTEDLNFSLLEPEVTFNFNTYKRAIETELIQFGFNVKMTQKVKSNDSTTASALFKANIKEYIITVEVPDSERARCHLAEQLIIALEIDTNPPHQFETTVNYLLQPTPYSVKTFSEPDLFTGKLHALLCRSRKSRVNGRDWYDYVWLVGRRTPVNLAHLEKRMRQSNHYDDTRPLSGDMTKELIHRKVDKLDIDQAKQDILPFIGDPREVDIWSLNFFHGLTEQLSF